MPRSSVSRHPRWVDALKSKPTLQDTALSLLWRLPYGARRRAFRTLSPKTYRRFQAMRHIETARGRSLKPFDDHRCIFVHIPKCAGISVSRTLFGNLGGAHLTVPHYQLIFSEREFEEYFKFTFVRNPWDRLVSAFRFLKRGGVNPGDWAWARDNLGRYDGFDEFVRRWVNRRSVHRWKHFVPQHRFVCEPGDEVTRVNFVGYFENLGEGFEHVRRRLGVPTRLKHLNPTRGRSLDYRDAYTAETRDIVAEVYAEDIRIFGYDFDGVVASRRAELTRSA
jgi:hypothetical protein